MRKDVRRITAFRILPGLAALLLMGAGCREERHLAGNPYVASFSFTEESSALPSAEQDVVAPASTEKQIAFREKMARLWEDHVTWTRLSIVSAAGGLKDREATVARLMKNQEDLGNMIGEYAGSATGVRLTALLKAQVDGAAKALEAAKAGNQVRLDTAAAAWRSNGDEVAALLSAVDPTDWPLAAVQSIMKKYFDLTLAEANDYLTGAYDESVKEYDALKDHVYMLSRMLADGIIKTYPERF